MAIIVITAIPLLWGGYSFLRKWKHGICVLCGHDWVLHITYSEPNGVYPTACLKRKTPYARCDCTGYKHQSLRQTIDRIFGWQN